MNTPLLKLVDGDLLEFSEDNSHFDGCETCDYGSTYVQSFTVKTTQGDTRFELEKMYSYPITHDFFFKTILPNIDKIKEMTITQFIQYLEEQFEAAGGESWGFSDYTVKVKQLPKAKV